MIVWEKQELNLKIGIDLLVKGLCVMLKSLNYSLKAKVELLQNFKQENELSRFVIWDHYSRSSGQGGQSRGREASDEADAFIWL